MCYPAHIRITSSGEEVVQTVAEHCRGCARGAEAAAPPGLAQTAALAGLLHDLGKYTDSFKTYIERASRGMPVSRGSVNHTFAGVRFIWQRWHNDPREPVRQATAELLAFAAGSHHGQFDCLSPNGEDGYLHRVNTQNLDDEIARDRFFANCADLAELDRRFDAAAAEVFDAIRHCSAFSATQEEARFHLALLARGLLSAVIEGDRRDTAAFEHQLMLTPQDGLPPWRWQQLLERVEEKLNRLPAKTPVDEARKEISDLCCAAAKEGGGIYRLTVPTGGGKTLASLRYALAAAVKGKKRLFFVIPLLSVLEQNAQVIRSYLEDDSVVLEHHSNVVRALPETDEWDPRELLFDTWDSPVVITTLVQLLNTISAGQTSCIRRFHSLTDSVIVVDEVQSVPRHMLSQFNLAVNFLSAYCGACVVLCSATQPCLERTAHPLRCAPNAQLVAQRQDLWQAFVRTQIIDRRRPQGYSEEELAEFAVESAAKEKSLLMICNTKAEAKTMYNRLATSWPGLLFHLSTSMCMAHRIQTMKALTAALAAQKPLICVSTQLVEAGVDFSFGCVIRLLAGLDNIVQSAGRCNRSGLQDRLGPVYIVNLKGESLNRLPEILQSKQAAESVLLRFAQNPADFDGDLTGAAAVEAFYRALYQEMPAGGQDYPLPELKTTLFDLLSINRCAVGHGDTGGDYLLRPAFRTAGEKFHVFEDNTQDVLTPYGEGAGLIAELGGEAAKYDLALQSRLVKRAAKYSVSLYRWQIEALQKRQGIYPVCGGLVLALQPWAYSADCGVTLEDTQGTFWEVYDGI